MQTELRNLLSTKNVNLDDVSYGFHWPPFTSIDHLHMHAIAPASKMRFVARQVFKPINMWYCSVSKSNVAKPITSINFFDLIDFNYSPNMFCQN